MTRLLSLALAALLLAGCLQPAPPAGPPAERLTDAAVPPPLAPQAAARQFAEVVARVEPVAVAVCREQLPRGRCDFNILVDDRPGQPVNAYFMLEPDGRPRIVFTRALIAEARTPDEVAFVLGHEAAHHIAGHIPRMQSSATVGALVLGTIVAQASSGLPASVAAARARDAARIGAAVGGRVYSKEHELEADALGAVIAWRAGYDPERGLGLLLRLPDPGDRFLGSHPSNAERVATVRAVRARLAGG